MRRFALTLFFAGLTACGGGDRDESAAAPQIDEAWVGTWATAPYGPYPAGPLAGTVPAPFDALTTPLAFPDEQAVEQSFRMLVHPTLGGDTIRVRLSNLMGTQAVTFGAVRVALGAAGSSLVPGTDTAVFFNEHAELILPPGDEAISDPISFRFAVGDDIAISFYIREQSGPMTWHAVSFDTQFVSPQNAGDVTADVTGAAFTETSLGWFFISGLDVLRDDSPGTIVALGDSITDGAYQTPGTNTRWPDFLATRLQSAGIAMGVLNEGINSNKVTASRDGLNSGPAAENRFDRDVLARSGVRSLVILEGTNDLASGATAEEVIAALNNLTNRAHEANLCVVLGTIMPRDDVTFGWDRNSMESERQTINLWIRDAAANGTIEGLAQFDVAMGAPGDTSRPNPLLYAPDLLHPNSAGFSVMADAVPLDMLVPPPAGNCDR